jgi:hypothetical protein
VKLTEITQGWVEVQTLVKTQSNDKQKETEGEEGRRRGVALCPSVRLRPDVKDKSKRRKSGRDRRRQKETEGDRRRQKETEGAGMEPEGDRMKRDPFISSSISIYPSTRWRFQYLLLHIHLSIHKVEVPVSLTPCPSIHP